MKYIASHHEFLENLLGKHGFYPSPDQMDEAIHFASLSRFQELYGDDAEYRPGEPLPRRAWQVTQNITDKLQPFLREMLVCSNPASIKQETLLDLPAPIAFVSGNKFKLPADWVHPTAMRFIDSVDALSADLSNYLFPSADVKHLDDDKVGRRQRSLIVGPTRAFPFTTADNDGYRVFPLPAGLLYVRYLALPRRPKMGMIFNEATKEYDYNDNLSVDTGWPPIEHNDILMKAAEVLGVPLQALQLMGFARNKAQSGA